MLYPDRLNYGAYASILKAMGDDVDVNDEMTRVFAFKGVFNSAGNMRSVAVSYRKNTANKPYIAPILVMFLAYDEEIQKENIEVSEYAQIAEVKKQIKEFLEV